MGASPDRGAWYTYASEKSTINMGGFGGSNIIYTTDYFMVVILRSRFRQQGMAGILVRGRRA